MPPRATFEPDSASIFFVDVCATPSPAYDRNWVCIQLLDQVEHVATKIRIEITGSKARQRLGGGGS